MPDYGPHLFQTLPHGNRFGKASSRTGSAARLSTRSLGLGADGGPCRGQIPQLSHRDRRQRVSLPGRLRRLPAADDRDLAQRWLLERRHLADGSGKRRGLGRRSGQPSTSARSRAFATASASARCKTWASRRSTAAAGWEAACCSRPCKAFNGPDYAKRSWKSLRRTKGAIRLYRRMGFYKARTVYKAVEMVSCAAR